MKSPPKQQIIWDYRNSVVIEGVLNGQVVACLLKDANGFWRLILSDLDNMAYDEPRHAMRRVEEEFDRWR